MNLQRIESGIRGSENRVFECSKCFAMKTLAVPIDPMKSKKAAWSSRFLDPPA